MKIYGEFLRDDTGAITIDWVALTAGILLLGIMVVYAIFNGGVAGLVGDINTTLAGLTTDVSTGPAPNLNGIDVASSGDPMDLGVGVPIPVGSTVSVGPLDIGVDVVAFTGPDGTVLFKTSAPSSSTLTRLDGATVSSSTTFELSDGSTMQLSELIGSAG